MIKKTSNAKSCRTGFTLIELMVVMVIIAILIGLLIPAVSGAMRRARIVGVKNEIDQLETAIAKFKSDHSIEPPSSITLHEAPADWASDPTSTAVIRQIWPQFSFAMPRDLNGNGSIDTGVSGAFRMTGSECLVFFLGGMFTKSTVSGVTLYSMTGFSKDPTNPFALGGSREASLFEFRADRLIDVDNDSIPEYKDGLPGQKNPYLYYSGYDGQGYNALEFLPTTLANPQVTYGLYAPYRQGPDPANVTLPFPDPWKPSSHQIISPGYDNQYGYGGAYLASGTDRLPVGLTPPALVPLRAKYEGDNITNFSQSELQP